MTATYNADNTITELPGMDKPKKPRRKDYDLIGAMISADMLKYEFDLAVYKGHVSQLRTLPCSPECRGLWAAGQTIQEGKDYVVRSACLRKFDNDCVINHPCDRCELMAFLLPVKSEDDLWYKAIDLIMVAHDKGLSKEDAVGVVKSQFIITKR